MAGTRKAALNKVASTPIIAQVPKVDRPALSEKASAPKPRPVESPQYANARLTARVSAHGWQLDHLPDGSWWDVTARRPDGGGAWRTDHAGVTVGDLGIERLKPAISPMRFDRLTVILTADFA